MNLTLKRILSSLLVVAGLATITGSEFKLRDRNGPFVDPAGNFIHDAGGHTRNELLGDGIGFVMAVVGGSLLLGVI